MAENNNADVKKMPFERAIEELDRSSSAWKKARVPLEESFAIYERGEALKARCDELFRQAEARVDRITLDANGGYRQHAAGRGLTTAPFDKRIE